VDGLFVPPIEARFGRRDSGSVGSKSNENANVGKQNLDSDCAANLMSAFRMPVALAAQEFEFPPGRQMVATRYAPYRLTL
jgi:hypothetical protein